MKNKEKEVVINVCFGGFGLSQEAYEELIKLGIPVKKYQSVGPDKDGLYKKENKINSGNVIFEGGLSFGEKYWETWLSNDRENPMLIEVVKKLGEKVNGYCAKLKIVKIPENIEYVVEEYDGNEHIAEAHDTWG